MAFRRRSFRGRGRRRYGTARYGRRRGRAGVRRMRIGFRM